MFLYAFSLFCNHFEGPKNQTPTDLRYLNHILAQSLSNIQPSWRNVPNSLIVKIQDGAILNFEQCQCLPI